MDLSTYVPLGILLLLQFSGYVVADDECKDMTMSLMEGQMMNMVPCITELGLNSGKERSDSYNCIMKCMLRKGGILTPEGGVTVLQSIIAILEMFPNKYVEKAFMEITKCQEFAGQSLSDPNDKHCNKYGPLLNCGLQFMLNVCRDV